MQHSADLITATHLIKKILLKNLLKAAKKLAEDNDVELMFKTNSQIRIKKTFFEYEGKHQPVTDPQLKFRANFFNILAIQLLIKITEMVPLINIF